jgi:starch-binding outer membrane protein, SusD/RagB family
MVLSCKKYLATKPDQRLSTPDKLTDLQALLDNQNFYRFSVVSLQDGADEYYLPYSTFLTFLSYLQGIHVWNPQVNNELDWSNQYALILICNTVLERIDKVNEDGNIARNEVKGAALFKRAFSYYRLAQVYASAYNASSANTELGIVLRDDVDFNIPSKRATLQQTYDRIVADLENAANLLPSVVVANTRPNKAAAFGLLARVYLQMGLYQKAKLAADASLTEYSVLVDFNDPTEVKSISTLPFINAGLKHKEILYYCADGSSMSANSSARFDSTVYATYNVNDMRRSVYFAVDATNNSKRFRGSYIGSSTSQFVGVATDEIYLIRAESNARLNNVNDVIQDLTALLSKRYKNGTAPTLNPASVVEALDMVLMERRKELVLRGLRWSDVRRYNKLDGSSITLKRDLNGTVYTLPPNDMRYALLLPRVVMSFTNMPQNPR